MSELAYLASRLAGQWMKQFGPVGLGWMDALIAATATVAGIPLLTRDRGLVQVLQSEAEFVQYD